MNHVAASMQEHCFMINITNHKSLFLRRLKKHMIWEGGQSMQKSIWDSREKTREGLCVCTSVNGGEKGASGQRDRQRVGRAYT